MLSGSRAASARKDWHWAATVSIVVMECEESCPAGTCCAEHIVSCWIVLELRRCRELRRCSARAQDRTEGCPLKEEASHERGVHRPHFVACWWLLQGRRQQDGYIRKRRPCRAGCSLVRLSQAAAAVHCAHLEWPMVTEHLHPLLYDASSLVLLPRWICLSTRHRLPTWPAHARYMVPVSYTHLTLPTKRIV